MFNLHRILAGLGAALVVIGHNVPGPVGWVCMAVGVGVTSATDGRAVMKGDS